MAEHTAEVIEVTELIPHQNADTLSLIRVGDFQVVVKTYDWECGDLGIYIEPDTVVPDTKEFEFLGKNRRIKAMKLRGEWSTGLLVHAPVEAKIGDNYFVKLGLEHWEPNICGNFTMSGDNVQSPPGFFPVYDIPNFRKYSGLFSDGEEVIVTEKLHGVSARYCYINDSMYCSSRRNWKKKDENDLWWKALSTQDSLQSWCIHNPGLSVFGEVFGCVQSLKYGASKGGVYFAAFDIWTGNKWLDFDEAHKIGSPLPWVPLVYSGPFDKGMMLEFAEGDSGYPSANHLREGVVVKPIHERTDPTIGRLQLKIVSNRYLEKS